MALATLLHMNADDPRAFATFFFEEAMAHRTQLGAMAPLTRFSALPYFIDPPLTNNGMWWLLHQTAQSDANSTLPTWGEPNPPYPGTFNVAVLSNQNLLDTDLTDYGQREWFTFVNHHEQFVSAGFLPSHLLPAW